MCQIQFIYNKKGINQKDVDELMKLMCFGSLSNNKDAWGIFNKKKMIKRSGEFNPNLIEGSFTEGNFLVGHNRFSTIGIGPLIRLSNPFKNKKTSYEENIQHHPFELNNFTLVHNGVISNASSIFNKYKIDTQIKTDSYAIIYLINYYSKISLKQNRMLKVIDAIRQTSRVLEGWYSVILYDKKDNSLYYFRNNDTTFHFNIVNNNLLVGSSKNINLKYTYINKQKQHFIPKKNSIYLIGKTKDGFCTEVGKLSKCKMTKSEIKVFITNESPGEIYKLINSLPGKPTNYEISENLKLKIFFNNKNKTLLSKYFKQKEINYKLNKNQLIIKLADIYNGK